MSALQPRTIPALSDHIRRCELFGVPEGVARIRFREFMSKREAPETAREPRRPPVPNSLQYPLERESDLQRRWNRAATNARHKGIAPAALCFHAEGVVSCFGPGEGT